MNYQYAWLIDIYDLQLGEYIEASVIYQKKIRSNLSKNILHDLIMRAIKVISYIKYK